MWDFQLRLLCPPPKETGAGNDFPKLSREVSSYLPHMVYKAVQENLFLLFKSCEGTSFETACSSFERHPVRHRRAAATRTATRALILPDLEHDIVGLEMELYTDAPLRAGSYWR